MLCTKCFSQIPDDATVCPFCKAKNPQKKFRVNIPEEKLEETEELEDPRKSAESGDEVRELPPLPDISELFSDGTKEKKEEEPLEEKAAFAEEGLEPEENEQPSELSSEPDESSPAEEESQKPDEPEERGESKPAVLQKEELQNALRLERLAEAQTKKEKKARISVFVLAAFCAVAMVALTFVGKYTDVFKVSPDNVKTVAFSGFSQSEKTSFEGYAGFFSAFLKTGFDKKTVSQDELLERFLPQKNNGLYYAFFGKTAAVVTDEADPAHRFESGKNEETGESVFGYCKVKKSSVEKIFSNLGKEIVHCANSRDYYYYDGYYYFAADKSDKSTSKYSVGVSESKRTEDGNYYVVCSLQKEGSEKKSTLYCTVSLTKSDEGNRWQLLELSSSPLFSEDGKKIVSESGKGVLSYEMKTEKIEVKTKNGIHFADYIIEYPVFTTSTDSEDATTQKAALTLNTLYEELLSKYKAQAETANTLYRRYTKKGGKKSALPAYTYVSSRVTFDRNGYISLLEETNEYIPLQTETKAAESTDGSETEPVNAGILLPTTTFEGYTLNIETGEFVKKDSVLGKDYYSIQQKLFSIYYQAHNEVETDAETGEPVIPADTEEVGMALSSSAWSLSDSGVSFSYLNPLGFSETVVLPFGEITDTELKF